MTSELDHLVLDIELVLISVVQGVALTFLGEKTVEILNQHAWQYLPYPAYGLILILFFWSQSIVHALSFIRWPLNLYHTFLYFIAAFLEVVIFSQADRPLEWYFLNIIFFAVAWLIYHKDSLIISQRSAQLSNHAEKEICQQAAAEQRFGLRYLVPLGVLTNLVSWYLIWQYPSTFIDNHYHLLLGFIQATVSLGILVFASRRFTARATLLEKGYQSKI